MRRTAWPALGLALATALATAIAAPPSSAADKKPAVERLGRGPAYDALAALAVQHEGRVKPLDTLAREELKQIYGRERITFVDDEGETIATWEPVAAVLDWSARPDYWDDQPILKVEYLPLKRVLLSAAIKEALPAIAAKPSTSAADREAIEKAVELEEVGDAELAGLLRLEDASRSRRPGHRPAAYEARRREQVAHREGAGGGPPRVDGRPTTFAAWSDSIQDRMAETRKMTGNDLVLSDLEQAAYDAGVTLSRYRQLRDLEYRGGLPIRVVPRPSNEEHIRYSASRSRRHSRGSHTGERDAAPERRADVAGLEVQGDHSSRRSGAIFGETRSRTTRYAAWLANASPWVPVAILLKSDESELTKAGFPASSLAEFRSAWKRFEEAERSSPGHVDEATATALVSAAREARHRDQRRVLSDREGDGPRGRTSTPSGRSGGRRSPMDSARSCSR